MADPQPLRDVVGDRVRAVRESAGVRQQDLSDAARRLGLTTWTRTRIAALERGDKAISAEDVVRLLAVLNIAIGRLVDLAELFDSPARVALSDVASIPARAVADVLRGGDTQQHVKVARGQPGSGWNTPERAAAAALGRLIRRSAGRTPLPTVDETRAVSAGLGEADERAARDLGLASYPFEMLCLVLWGRSLSAERDERLTGVDNEGAASLAARRGRVTRELLAEARARLAEVEEKGADRGERPEAP